MNDSIGTPVKLSEVYAKHEYTLVDFWASWCGPCRGENPNVVAVWKDYNAKGFHVIGVSCDSDKAKWLKAIADDKLTWSHVFRPERLGQCSRQDVRLSTPFLPTCCSIKPAGSLAEFEGREAARADVEPAEITTKTTRTTKTTGTRG